MPLQQLVVELHHLLVLFELQHALAQVESQRKTHFLQRLPLVCLLVHLPRTRKKGWDGRWGVVRDVAEKMLKGYNKIER